VLVGIALDAANALPGDMGIGDYGGNERGFDG
jgi:hypothetical protein